MAIEVSNVIEQYKGYLQDVGNIGVRHENSRRFYLSVVSALFVFLTMAGEDGPFAMVRGRVLLLVGIFGIALCVVWGMHMQAYAALYAAKFEVLRKMETGHELFQVFSKEWDVLKSDPRYGFLTLFDTVTPILFIGLFIAILNLK